VAIGYAAIAANVNRSSDLVTAGLVVSTGAQATYHSFWKPSGISPAIVKKSR